MALPVTFANLSPPQQQSIFDTMFAAVSAMSVIPCNAAGVNILSLTPMANAASLIAYGNLQLFSFIAPGTTTAAVRAAFMSLPQLTVYGLDGVTQIGPSGIIGGSPYMLMFNKLLNLGAGGFYLLNFGTGQGPPPGAGQYYFGPPSIDPAGWYICDGRAVSRSIDAPLFAAIGTTYGIGDGSTTFNIPRPGGLFMRVLDMGAGNDPGRALGSVQQDQLQDHTHLYVPPNGNVGASGSAVNAGAGSASTSIPNSGNHGAETRPKNMAAPMIIKR